MGEQERIRILELAWEMALFKRPTATSSTEARFEEWHKLFDKTYKAIMQTTLEKETT
jgi:hypothetical protein